MPISKYFKGEGSKVMKDMKSRYGSDKGESVFYATANKRGMKPGMKANKKQKQHLSQGFQNRSY
jgi:hypothetical protein